VVEALIALPFGLAIGLIVGGVGGGGAILALPVLVYVLGEGVGPASTASLIVIAVAGAVGAGALAFRGHVCWQLALTFSVPAAVGSLLGTFAGAAVSPKALILAFVPVMLVAAGAAWRGGDDPRDDGPGDCPDPAWSRILIAGLGVGVLTGFFGVGGGFLIVPVLTLWLGASFRRSVATSLVIVTLTGLAALAGHLGSGSGINLAITVALAGSTAVGAFVGTMVGRRLPQAQLRRAFAVVVTAVAVFLLVDTLFLGGPPGA
jgi:uncharacterized protein